MNARRIGGIVVIVFVALATLTFMVAYILFTNDIQKTYEGISSLTAQLTETPLVPLEYLTMGEGYPVILVHGMWGGVDQGLVEARNYLKNFKAIIVSRFGYFRTPFPSNASPALQAEAYTYLLDTLGVDKAAIVGISAGSTSSLQFALKYSDRCLALILLSSQGPSSASLPPKWAFSMFAQTDSIMWVASTYFRSMMVSLIGVPKEILAQRTPEDEKHVDDILATLLPVKLRSKGILFDAYVATPDIATFPFEQVRVPTVVFHAKDDPLSSFRSARSMAERIPNAKFVAFEKGGHLLLGNEELVESEILNFLTHCINFEANEKRDLSSPLYQLNPSTLSTR